MTEKTPNEVDRYLAESLRLGDPALDAALAANEAAHLPAIDVSPLQGQLLNLLARMIGARRILEIGTLGGYSTICLARAVGKQGRVITLEAEPAHAAVAKSNIANAGLADAVDLRIGFAIDLLPALTAEAPFDLIFLDADKPSMPDYLTWALKLSRPGTVIVGDNVVRQGEVANPDSIDPSVQGVQRFLKMIGENPRLSATALQTVGGKGWDGLAIALVGEEA
ncbi:MULTISPECIES: O-methyltransferase [Rhodomicrobium]|uniref:O-methyltransferase n=1 Tax=Rhodomicrobium TaxID=1068 RepID=UPI000B4A7166|nr:MULTISPECIES: O-methyltransferase [Rhodomicrobium]